MSKHTGMDMPVKVDRKATIRVDVPSESKAKMDMAGMKMGKEVSMICKGKISRLTDDEMGKSMEMEMSSMEMMGGGKSPSMIDQMSGIKAGRKM